MKTLASANTALSRAASVARICAAVVALAALFLSPEPACGADEITFAVPDAGRITLGVFDQSGKLVRTLHRLATEKDFRVEDNGYSTRWDGADDAGRRLPAGHYHVRGYLVGSIKVEGEDYHFNDWAADEPPSRLGRIIDFALLENGDLVVLCLEESKLAVGRYSPEHGFLWKKSLPATGDVASADSTKPGAGSPMLATNDASAIVFAGGGWNVVSLDNGEAGTAKSFDGSAPPAALAARPGTILTAAADGLFSIDLTAWTSRNLQPPPPAFRALDADATRLIGAADDGLRLRKADAPFEKVPLAAEVTSVSLGTGDTFWIVGSEAGSPDRVVAQASPSGEILRTLRPEPGDPRPDKIRASRTAEKFATLESKPGLQRLRIMERAADGAWTINWQHTIEDCSRFGFVNDRAAADAGDKKPARELAFRLDENPLTGKRETLTLRAVFDKTGTRLVTPDGLPIVEISPQTDISRIAVSRGDAPGTMRLLQGNGLLAEEFSISGLGRILPIDAGDVDLR